MKLKFKVYTTKELEQRDYLENTLLGSILSSNEYTNEEKLEAIEREAKKLQGEDASLLIHVTGVDEEAKVSRPKKVKLYDDHESHSHNHHREKEEPVKPISEVKAEELVSDGHTVNAVQTESVTSAEIVQADETSKAKNFWHKVKVICRNLKKKFITLCSPFNRAVRDRWNALPEQTQKRIALGAAVFLVLFAFATTYFYFFTDHRSYDPLYELEDPVNVTDTLDSNADFFGDAPKTADPNAFKEAPATVDTARRAAPVEETTTDTPAEPATTPAPATPAATTPTPVPAEPAPKAETPATPAKQTTAEPVGAPDEH